MKSELTPLMRQYWDIKNLHPDKILMFRMGDFFEMFYDDAIQAAPVLGIALTSRNKKAQDETPMCGMPHHSIGMPINKLLQAGFKVAICDQVEDPALAKGLVKRALTRILTPGMVYDPDQLEATRAHYLACFADQVLACWDTTTGEAFYFRGVQERDLPRLLSLLPIAEWVESAQAILKKWENFSPVISLHEQLADETSIPTAARRLLSYVRSASPRSDEQTTIQFEERALQGHLDLSATTVRHLEIFENSQGEESDTLFQVINRTKTSAGGRALRQRLCFPLCQKDLLEQRLNEVTEWLNQPSRLQQIRQVLGRMGDLERRLGKLSQSNGSPRDLRALAESTLSGLEALQMADLPRVAWESLDHLGREILSTVVEEPPLSTKQGGVIQSGVHSGLDELIQLSSMSQSLVHAMEERERSQTGISSLKIRYNNVFGYYIEITHAHKDKVPKHYSRKQTLANAERFCTDELVDLERKVLSAQTRRTELESEIYESLRKKCLTQSALFQQLSERVAHLDVTTAGAWLALENKFCRPRFTEGHLSLRESRHPVVESVMKNRQGRFVPNQIELSHGHCLLLTGPNMAGKSTLMRQVALTVIMAQIGFYVPAASAELPIFDHCFTRIGASDQLAKGLSTFMVEMTETSLMLERATSRSLLILDEVGRGTSTFDGMSLAQAILEHLLEKVGAMTFFATHYHELTTLAGSHPQLHNAHMRVVENRGDVQFLHTLAAGPAQKSYGLYVAKIAGLPVPVLQRAAQLLKSHESKSQLSKQMSLLEIPQPEFETASVESPIWRKVRELQVEKLTPLQALNELAHLQEILKTP